MLTKIKAIGSTVWADIVDTYKRLKILLIAIAAAIIYLEWNKISEAITIAQGNKEVAKDNKKDTVLSATETSDSQKADALVADAKKLADQQKPPIGDDWNKK